MTYLCPKCNALMFPVIKTSLPPITSYWCAGCGYRSKEIREEELQVTLPTELRDDNTQMFRARAKRTVAPGTYRSRPTMDSPLLHKIDSSTLVAWFRCCSCKTCRWKTEVLDKDTNPYHDTRWCSQTHERMNIVDMVKYFGYSKE